MLCMRHKNGDGKKGEKNAPKRGFPCVFGGFSAIDKGGKLWYNRGEKKTWGRTPDGGSMNCVNCGSRLTFFNETDALWSGTDRALCASCRKKITPFLEEAAPDGNVQHLHDRRDALIARGVTPEGFAHLNDYCKHLDALLAKRRRQIPDEIPAEPIPEGTEKVESEGTAASPVPSNGEDLRVALAQQRKANEKLESQLDTLTTELADSTRILCDRLERMRERIRLLIYLASIGAVGGVLAFLVSLIVLFR